MNLAHAKFGGEVDQAIDLVSRDGCGPWLAWKRAREMRLRVPYRSEAWVLWHVVVQVLRNEIRFRRGEELEEVGY